MSDPSARTTRAIALAALALSLVALVLAGYALHGQQQAHDDLRRIGRELSRSLAPQLPMNPPPPGLDPDDT